MIDLSTISDEELARWARARIQRDYLATSDALDRAAGIPCGFKCDVGINLEYGVVVFRDLETDEHYLLAPSDTLTVHSSSGKHRAFRNGVEILHAAEQAVAHLN